MSDTTELHRRIEELTAELASVRQQGLDGIAAVEEAATGALATERAAREQALKQLAHTEDLLQGAADSARNWEEMCQQAERERDSALEQAAKDRAWCGEMTKLNDLRGQERDTALERVKELEADREIELQARVRFVDRAEAAETALASANERVKELEAKNESLREECDLFSQDKVATEATLTRSREAHGLTIKRCTAAESALASARELLQRVHTWHAWPDTTEPGPEPGVCLLNAVDTWLKEHP